jgi:lipopolysaccharide heptosyltransferase II
MKSSRLEPGSRAELALIEQLKQARFDGVVIFTVYSQSSFPAVLLAYLAEIPLRLAHARENPYALLTDWLPEPEPQQLTRHEVQRQLDLVAAVGFHAADEHLHLRVAGEDRRNAMRKLEQAGVDPAQAWLVVHPGGSAPARRWQVEGFAAAAGTLAREDRWQVVLTGGRDETSLVEAVRAGTDARLYSLAGKLTLGELIALLQSARLLVSNNTGPVHLASAVGTPVVDLYALTNPQHAPWGVPQRVLWHDVPCKFCYKSICPQGHHDCLRLVTPQQVVAAVRGLLQEIQDPPGESHEASSLLPGARRDALDIPPRTGQ